MRAALVSLRCAVPKKLVQIGFGIRTFCRPGVTGDSPLAIATCSGVAAPQSVSRTTGGMASEGRLNSSE